MTHGDRRLRDKMDVMVDAMDRIADNIAAFLNNKPINVVYE